MEGAQDATVTVDPETLTHGTTMGAYVGLGKSKRTSAGVGIA